jgi:iron complex transport system substrate-binding protein
VIGAEELLVAVDDIVDYPPEAAVFPEKIAWEDIDADAIAAYEPDLVIVSFESFRHVGLVSELDELGLKVWCCDADNDTLHEALEWMLLLGHMVDRQDEAENLVAELGERISDVEQAVAEIDEAEQLSVFWEVCLTCAPGHNTLPNDILRTLKLKNLTGNFAGGTGFVEVDLRTIVPPGTQVFIVGDVDLGVTVERVSNREWARDIVAIREGRIYEVDRAKSNRPGPRNVDVLEELAALIYPDLF